MASYHRLYAAPRFESPAKVFAKLKSKVQREELCSVRERHGAELRTPRKTSESTWTDEAQALTLSPISSPQKTFGYADISSTQRQRKGAFLESTAVSQLSFLVNRKQIHTDPPQFRDMGEFNASSRTPVKIQPVNNDSVGGEFEEASPAFRFSPMKKKLRKRKCEPLEVNMVSSSTKEFSNEATSQAREMETSSAFREDDTHIEACMEDLGPVRGFTAEPSEMNPPPRSIAMKRERLFLSSVFLCVIIYRKKLSDHCCFEQIVVLSWKDFL